MSLRAISIPPMNYSCQLIIVARARSPVSVTRLIINDDHITATILEDMQTTVQLIRKLSGREMHHPPITSQFVF